MKKGATITMAGKLGSEPSIITNMYKILIEEEHMIQLMLKVVWVKPHSYLMR